MTMERPVTKEPKRRIWLISLVLAITLLAAGVAALRVWYDQNLKPVSSAQQTVYFTVHSGDSVRYIGNQLQDAGLIRNGHVFETYVRSRELHDKLQAGTYALSPSMSVQQIVDKMASGEVSRNLLTILPGKRLDQIKLIFAKAGYSGKEIKEAFNPATYQGHPALASLPKGASLEGFLYPDSFEKQANTPAKVIIRESLDEMNSRLTPDLVNAFAKHGLSVYKAVTLASIVGQETDNPKDQPIVAQVFYSRLAQAMPLGSDVTAYYAAVIAGQSPSLGVDSPYNTRLHTGLPPGPISNVTIDALQAVANPANTDYLYFLFGDDKKMHFAHTNAQHEANIQKYCAKSCAP